MVGNSGGGREGMAADLGPGTAGIGEQQLWLTTHSGSMRWLGTDEGNQGRVYSRLRKAGKPSAVVADCSGLADCVCAEK